MYVLLVGGPGIGKTDALRDVLDVYTELKDIHVAPSSVSRASLIDALNNANRSIFKPTAVHPLEQFNSLNVVATEFGTFLAGYESEFMSTLNDLYDCVRYTEKKRGMKEDITIVKPQLNILAGTTPSWLGGVLPQHAWGEGFTSRMTMIFSGERITVDPFSAFARDNRHRDVLITELGVIHALGGQFLIDEEVRDAYRAWYMAGMKPEPDHPKLEHYLPRRNIHLLKLVMAFSAARSDELLLRIEDYRHAMDLLIEAEHFMPDVFKSMNVGAGDATIIDETYRFIKILFAKEDRPIDEHRIIYFLQQRAPAYTCQKILETMVSANLIRIASVGAGGRNAYRPASS